MWTTILGLATPIILWLIKTFISGEAKKAEYIKSYYKFLEDVDKIGEKKVQNHLSAKDALEAEQQKLEKRLEDMKKGDNV